MSISRAILRLMPTSSSIALAGLLYRFREGAPSLSRLCEIYGSDKHGFHFYAQHYEHHFKPLRRQPLRILEIGIGGYDDPSKGGASLRVWEHFFPRAQVFGLDIHPKSVHDTARITTLVGDQSDSDQLRFLTKKYGPFDIIIDDGSHLNNHVVSTFCALFPLLAPNGIYAVEDLQTSYWEEAFGRPWDGSADLAASHTSMGFFKTLADGLNHVEFRIPDYEPSYFDRHVTGLYFYHNLVFVQKGLNDEPATY